MQAAAGATGTGARMRGENGEGEAAMPSSFVDEPLAVACCNVLLLMYDEASDIVSKPVASKRAAVFLGAMSKCVTLKNRL